MIEGDDLMIIDAYKSCAEFVDKAICFDDYVQWQFGLIGVMAENGYLIL